jgi:hypothetical protein
MHVFVQVEYFMYLFLNLHAQFGSMICKIDFYYFVGVDIYIYIYSFIYELFCTNASNGSTMAVYSSLLDGLEKRNLNL